MTILGLHVRDPHPCLVLIAAQVRVYFGLKNVF